MSATLAAPSADSVPHPLPPRLLGLTQLANNVAWSWNRDARKLFSLIDDTLWGQLRHNLVVLLQQVAPERLAALAASPSSARATIA